MDLIGALSGAAGAAGETGNPNAWDISKGYLDAGPDAWDISAAVYSGMNFSNNSRDSNTTGVFFKPDGTKMYLIGAQNNAVYEYDLSPDWHINLLSPTFVQSFSIASQDTSPEEVFFKPDGTKMYMLGSSNDAVFEYSLSTAWNISTASYVQSFSVSTQDITPFGLFFKPDGTKMYILGAQNDSVYEYDLSTAWDISSASYLQLFSVATEELTPAGITFKPDGTKMYVTGATGDDINEYDLSTPWDVSSASYVQNFSVAAQETAPEGLQFHPQGGIVFVVGNQADRVHQYSLGVFDISTEETLPTGLTFKPDGTKMYVCGTTGDDVNEYSLSTAWDITTASYVQNFSVSAKDTAPSGVVFKSDGTKMYIVGSSSDSVHEYDLSSAWDISTASFLQSFSVATQDTTPSSIFFKDDGTKMYMLGRAGDDVNEYNLSTAWDISSASYLQNFSLAAQVNAIRGFYFGNFGTEMYVTDATDDVVYQYTLASAWDISSASYTRRGSTFVSISQSIFFRDNGEQFFIVDQQAPAKVVKCSILPD